MIAEERVIGVLVVASTDAKRAFTAQELSLLQAIAWEAALALERLRSASALYDALGREQAIGEIARRVRAEHDPEGIVRVAREELRRVLRADDVGVTTRRETRHGRACGAPARSRRAKQFLVDTVEHEVGTALRTARLLAENRRRLEQQAALLQAAQVVTSELDIETVLQRLVEEVTKLLGADAADCYLLDAERGVLRCAAVHGFDAGLLGFEFAPTQGVAAAALREARPVSSDEYASLAAPVPNPAYEGFHVRSSRRWCGQARRAACSASGCASDERSFDQTDVELLEAFASLASLALRNAESYAERTRQARVQRGFYRIASLLGEPLSLDETYDAAAQAAAEALGGDFAAVLVHGPSGLGVVGGHALPDAVRALAAAARRSRRRRTTARCSPRRDVADDERFDAAWRRGAVRVAARDPGAGRRCAGSCSCSSSRSAPFTRDDLELAQQVAGAARGALDRSRLFEAERTARALSQQLARTGSLLATELDPVAVLEAVVEEAAALLRRRRRGARGARRGRARRHGGDRRRGRGGARQALAVDGLARRRRDPVARARRARGRRARPVARRVGRDPRRGPPRVPRRAADGPRGRAARRPLGLRARAAHLA